MALFLEEPGSFLNLLSDIVIRERAIDVHKVKELMNGTGDFTFDWEVKCVRKGFEDYEVIRDERRAPASNTQSVDGSSVEK